MKMIYWCKCSFASFIRDFISFMWFIILKIEGALIPSKNKGIRILLYHSINAMEEIEEPMKITVSPKLFERQISYLINSGYKILSMDEVLSCLAGKREITGREVALTFDDGFEDNFDAAVNVLRKKGVTATYFITGNYTGTNEIFPWCEKDYPYSKPITFEKILKLISINMSIGSHTLDHVDLGEISNDRNRLYEEIAKSKKVLEGKTNAQIKYFAYPFGGKGSFNEITESIIRESGYIAAFTNIFGSNKKGDNVFELRRTRITNKDTLFKFEMKLKGAYDWVDKIVGFLGKII